MRLLVSFDIVVEPEPSSYLPTAIAKEMVNRPAIGTMESLYRLPTPGSAFVSVPNMPQVLRIPPYPAKDPRIPRRDELPKP